MRTLQEEIARCEYHIRLRAIHPLAFFALMQLNEEVDKIRGRMTPKSFAVLEAESRQAVALREQKRRNKLR